MAIKVNSTVVIDNSRNASLNSANINGLDISSYATGAYTQANTATSLSQSAFDKANTSLKTTTSATAPSNPNVGDLWYDTVMSVTLRYTNDGVSNNWVDITGPQNSSYILQTYSITPNTTSINETTNKTVVYTVATTNTADNTVLYWTNSGTTSDADFIDAVSNGTVTIINNSGTITRTIATDLSTESSETIILSLRTGSNTGPIVANASSVTVGDTSQTPIYYMYASGSSKFGQLGIGLNNAYRSSPTQVGSSTDWYSVKAGTSHSLGIRLNAGNSTSGTLWSWGNDDAGQTANGYRSSPTQVGALTNWSVISAGQSNSAGIKSDGTLWTWGLNNYGQLGINNRTDFGSPKQVGTDTNWLSVASNGPAMIALRTDGTLWLWGYNAYGQLGINNTDSRSSPTQVGTDTNWSKISAAPRYQNHNFAAIKTNGTLWTWGTNSGTGSLGLGNTTSKSSPTQVGSGTTWSEIAVGANHMLALKTDGTLWGWGSGNNGATGGVGDANVPTQSGTGTNWQKISAGYETSAAIKSDNTLWVFGANHKGELGLDVGNNNNITSPLQVGSGANWNLASVGHEHALFTTNS